MPIAAGTVRSMRSVDLVRQQPYHALWGLNKSIVFL